MKTAAVIAEFNPFHNGHKYLLDTIKKEYGIDYCIAIMSGDFVQRGDVAVVNKHLRAEMAIKAGFSAVFELPLIYATASAPDFAYGGACIAHKLGVDYLFFGSETGDTTALEKTADALLCPAPLLDAYINANVKKGLTYAKAVSEALISSGISDVSFSAPNDILAVEYIKALKKLNSPVKPIAIKRTGVDHNSVTAYGSIASATLLRSKIMDHHDISLYIPDSYDFYPLFMDDFMDMLTYRMHFITEEVLKNTPGISHDLSNKILKCSKFTEYRALVDACKSKNFSESSIRRALIHILLGLQKDPSLFPDGHVCSPTSLRLLAMKRDDSPLIKAFKNREQITIYTKPKDILDHDVALLSADISASDLYEKVYSIKYHTPFVSDCQKSPILL